MVRQIFGKSSTGSMPALRKILVIAEELKVHVQMGETYSKRGIMSDEFQDWAGRTSAFQFD
jgi:hypothetical protein